mgnify:CR=1 FL=1
MLANNTTKQGNPTWLDRDTKQHATKDTCDWEFDGHFFDQSA